MTSAFQRPLMPGVIGRISAKLIIALTFCLGTAACGWAAGEEVTTWGRFRVFLDGYGANVWPGGGDEKRIRRFAADLSSLSPRVSESEARKLAECAQASMNELRRKYRVVWPPVFHIVLIYYRHRDQGYCFQWTDALYERLRALNLRTLEVNRAIAYEDSPYENNCLVVQARGRPLREALVIDGWRYSGRLAWIPVNRDHYPWKLYVPLKARAAQKNVSPRSVSRSAPRTVKHQQSARLTRSGKP